MKKQAIPNLPATSRTWHYYLPNSKQCTIGCAISSFSAANFMTIAVSLFWTGTYSVLVYNFIQSIFFVESIEAEIWFKGLFVITHGIGSVIFCRASAYVLIGKVEFTTDEQYLYYFKGVLKWGKRKKIPLHQAINVQLSSVDTDNPTLLITGQKQSITIEDGIPLKRLKFLKKALETIFSDDLLDSSFLPTDLSPHLIE